MNKRYGLSMLAAAIFAVWGQSASALNISFDYSYDSAGFFNDATRRSTLQQAGNYLGSRISDNLTAISSSGNNQFTASFFDPSNGVAASKTSYSVAADTLVIFVGGQNLGAGALGLGGPGGYSVSGSQPFVDTVSARGQLGALATVPTDFGPWGGSVSFDNTSGTNWYFDTDVNTVEVFSGYDFFSVAIHELGHVLSSGDSGLRYINGSNFVGPNAMAAYGGNPVPLDADLAHWADGVASYVNGFPQDAAMTPSIAAGQRKYFTDLDFAALKDIGWQVTPVPVPAALWLLVSGLIGLVSVSRRK